MILILNMSLTIAVLASLDSLRRATTTAALLCDLPSALAVHLDVDPDAGRLLRTVHDRLGVHERTAFDLQPSRVPNQVCDAALGAVEQLLASTSAQARTILLVLPVAAEPLPVMRGLQRLVRALPTWRRPALGPVITAIQADRLEDDLLGDDLLADRRLALHPHDRRSVAEVVCHQVETSDAVVHHEPLDPRAYTLLRHLTRASTHREMDACEAVTNSNPTGLSGPTARADLRMARPTGEPDALGIWTLDLASWRPLHPGRLHEGIEAMTYGSVRGRGVFCLATRPHVPAAWDAAGGQVSIGVVGPWLTAKPTTRIIVTGRCGHPDVISYAFDRTQLTDAELSRGLDWWAGQDDGFDEWLGDRHAAR